MTPRERQLATLRHELPDRISSDTIAIEILPQIAERLGVAEDRVRDALGIDGRVVAAAYTGALREPVDGIAFTAWGTPNTGDYGTGHDRRG